MKIDCKKCNGKYVIREGRFGIFAGCSNYPKCNSTLKIFELVAEFILKNGVNIYKWEKECWKCRDITPIYSYYLTYQLYDLDELFSFGFEEVGIGDIEYFDNILMSNIDTIKQKYSKTLETTYVANTCIHCGALQGRNYVVKDPHEIIGELWHNRDMDKYLINKIKIQNLEPILDNLKEFYYL